MSTIEVVLDGKGPLKLTANDHLGTGGEGSVYLKGKTVIKIYTDPDEMTKTGKAEKIKLLSAIKHPFIIAPQGLVLDKKGKPIGYFMNKAKGEPLSRIFTNDWRDSNGFNDKLALQLAENMRQTVDAAHQAKALMIDSNEMNWVADKDKPAVFDVDSWAVGKFKASVIMPSIRDYHTNTFNELTDYFSFGVVSFQVFTGIHPYKGTLDGFNRGDMIGRMKGNASVFTPGVRLNAAVRDFSCIPRHVRDWYEAVFQKGERTIPPSFIAGSATVAATPKRSRTVIGGSTTLSYDKIYDATQGIAKVFPCGVVMLDDGTLVDLEFKVVVGKTELSAEVTRMADKSLIVMKSDGMNVVASHLVRGLQPVEAVFPIVHTRLFRAQGRVFAVTDRGITELKAMLFGQKFIVSAGKSWDMMVNSTDFLDGVAVSQVIKSAYLTIPIDEGCYSIRVPELDGLKTVSAVAGLRFVAVVAQDKTGTYRKLEFSFDKEYKTYTVWTGQTDQPELNMVVNPRGVVVTIVDDGELVLFPVTGGTPKKVPDKQIAGDMRLAVWDATILFSRGSEVWKVSTK